MIQKTGNGRLIFGLALGAAALSAPVLTGTAKADHHMAGDKAMMASAPMMVNGKVNNYWADESGYVTAVDLQTANGPAVVRMAPGLAMKTMQTYPVGSTADMWVKGSMEGGMQKWDLVGWGNKQPSVWHTAMAGSSSSRLVAQPYTAGDPTNMSVSGTLQKVVVDKDGGVVGLVLDTGWIGKGTPTNLGIWGGAMPEKMWEMKMGDASTWTLVRVPQGDAPNPHEGMRRKTPLRVNDVITAVGYLEAPLYGAVSPYAQRFYATGVAVNNRGVGQMGFASYKPDTKTLLNFNLNLPFITGGSDTNLPIVPTGYEVYSPQTGMMSGAMMKK